MHVVAAKAVAFKLAAAAEFKERQERTVRGAQILAERLLGEDVAEAGATVLTGGTDVHLVLVDLRNSALDGQQAEDLLHSVGITVNRNAVPCPSTRDRRWSPRACASAPRPWPPAVSGTRSSPRSPTSSPKRSSPVPMSRRWPPG